MKMLGGVLLILLVAVPSFAGQENESGEFLQWRYKMSGEERIRYEYKKDFDLDQSRKDNGSQFFHRFRLGGMLSLTDEYLKSKIDIFVEGLDAQTGGYRIKAASNQVDDFDLHQAYVHVHNIFGSDFDIKAGRQEFKYGKGRLIACPLWANRLRHFDGGVLHYQKDGLWGDLIYGQDVKYDDDKINQSRSEELLSGFYGGVQEHKMAPLVETYFLSLIDIKGVNDTHRYTTGVRLVVPMPAGTVVELEVPYQFGETGTTSAGTKDIRAYAFHVDVSKSLENSKWKPKLSVAYDEASGDKDPSDNVSNTFIPLYQSTHEPYGLLDFFRWQDVRNPEISLTISPTDKLKIAPQADFFWLQSKFDNWYNSSGGNVRTKIGGERGYYVGTELSLRAYYDLNKNLKLESGYAHFFPGGYVKDSGTDDDIDWLYTQMSLKF